MACLMEQLVGHREQKLRLLEALKMGRLPQGLLFYGPSGVGKRLLALALAQSLLCERERGEMACGQCASCLRVEKEQHENLLLVKPEGAQIKIEDSRGIVEFLALQSWSGPRLIIIDQAETLNPQASNALLKILEEPPAKSHFILITHQPMSLLPTIRSRCQLARFSPLKREELQSIVGAEGWVLDSAQGRVEVAQLLAHEEERELREIALKTLQEVTSSGARAAFAGIREEVRDRTKSLGLCRYWQQLLRDALFRKKNLSPLIHADQSGLLNHLSQCEEGVLSRLFLRSLELERDVEAHLDRSLAFECFLGQLGAEFWSPNVVGRT